MNPIFGFATHYLGVKTFLMGLNLLGGVIDTNSELVLKPMVTWRSPMT